MGSAGFVLAINLVIAGFIALTFMTISFHGPRRVPARWMALAYTIGMANPLAEFFIATFDSSLLLVELSFCSLLVAMAALNIGIARLYVVRVPWATMALVLIASAAICYGVQGMPRQSFVRMLLYQLPFFSMPAIAVGIVGQAKHRRGMDSLLIGLLALSGLQFLSKPFVFLALGGTGSTPSNYLATKYALVSQSMGTIFVVAIALVLMVILVREILSDATERSDTDALSGLLNRGGFENRAKIAIETASRLGLPVSLVVSDLDRFKSVNDTFGHTSGDNVIAGFAAFLQSSITSHQIAGRIGGEEFAILLPGTNVIAARLFAESARSTFSVTRIKGLPETMRFTASFGVAELSPGENFSDLFARADKALYLAKDSGRDCVKIAPRPDMRRAGDGLGTAATI